MRVVKPITFNSFDFSRASEATYYDEDGVLVTAAVDVLRFGYDPETLASIGPIFESAATNLLPYSNDFTAWIMTGSSAIGVETPPVNPDESAPVMFMDASGGSSAWGMRYELGALSGAHTFSVFVKTRNLGAGGASSITLEITGGGGFLAYTTFNTLYDTASVVSNFGTTSTNIEKLSNGEWLRLSMSITGTITTVSRMWIKGDDIANGGGGGNGNGFLYLWGAQLEPGSAPTSFIYTDGTAETRAADIEIISPPSLVTSNVPETDHTEWDVATAYVIDDIVMVTGIYHRNYKCLVAGTGDFPPDNISGATPKWLDIGATNRWRMFDNMVGADLQSSNSGSVDVTLSLAGRINTVALFNVAGVSATVRMFYGGEVIYEKTVSLTAPTSMTGWWSFWFEEKRKIKVFAFTDLPPATPSSVQIVIDGGSGTAAIGKAILGYGRDLGFAEYGTTSAGIIDYSTKEVDAFGNYFFLERRFVDTMDLRVVVDPGREAMVKDTLSEGRAKPYVYIGEDGYESLILLGRFIDFSILFSTPAASYCSMRIEGI